MYGKWFCTVWLFLSLKAALVLAHWCCKIHVGVVFLMALQRICVSGFQWNTLKNEAFCYILCLKTGFILNIKLFKYSKYSYFFTTWKPENIINITVIINMIILRDAHKRYKSYCLYFYVFFMTSWNEQWWWGNFLKSCNYLMIRCFADGQYHSTGTF